MNNNIDDILTRLQGQQPVIDNPDELTDSIMNSLPEQDDIVTKEHKSRLLPLNWRWEASLLVLIACGATLYFFSPEQPQNNIAEKNESVGDGLQVRTGRATSPLVTEKMPTREEVVSHGVQRVQDVKMPSKQPSTSPTEIPYADPNVHYAHHSAAANEDTTYLAPSLVDDFIEKLAKYNHIKTEPLECSVIGKDSTIQSTAYVFPDNDRIKLFERLLGVASQYSYKSPGYQFTISQQQILFCLEDHRLGLRYLWLAERIYGDRIILYATHSPIGISVSTECYQNFRENVTHTNKTFKL